MSITALNERLTELKKVYQSHDAGWREGEEGVKTLKEIVHLDKEFDKAINEAEFYMSETWMPRPLPRSWFKSIFHKLFTKNPKQ